MVHVLFCFFFFQAEDGIRDGTVTGVQTCALPILSRILLLGGDGGLEYRLGQFPGNVLVPVAAATVERSDFDIRALLVDEHVPDIVVLGPQVSRQTAMSLASMLDAMAPQITVVLVAEPTADVMLEAIRAGVRDVLPPEASDEEYRIMLLKAHDHATRRTVRRATEEPAEIRVVESRVVVVASPKGGVGKSTIAVNLAVGLARQAPQDVVVVDLRSEERRVGKEGRCGRARY